MIRIDEATDADAEALLDSAVALVTSDAGRHDAEATDLNWSAHSGAAYVAGTLASDSIALLARDGDRVVGHLVGRLSGPTSVHPVRVAELESIHVYPADRGIGVGSALVSAFLAWATEHGAARICVTAYAANDAALAFYAHHGFVVRSMVLDRSVDQPMST